MKKYFFAAVLFAFLQRAPVCPAQTELRTADYKMLVKNITLCFKDFPAEKSWNGKRRAPVLDTDLKKQYRTLITRNAAEQPNFNGIYRVAEFGAGTGWHGFFIINLETGAVTKGIFNEFGLEYTADSRMMLINPPETVLDYWQDEEYIPARASSSYLLFENGTFVKLLDLYNNE